jgi:hypothetical protein
MALTDSNTGSGFYMPVAPAYGGGGFGNGLGGDGWWILLLLLAFGGGWGFGGFGGMGGAMMGAGMVDGFGLYPWLNNSQHISDGFRDQQLQTSIGALQNSVTAGFGDVQLGIAGVNQNICQTGNGIVNALNSGFNSAEIAANSRAMANVQQLFGVQTGISDLKYTVATENCADRAALSDGIRDILAATQAQTQTVIDKLCALELEGVKSQLAAAQRENLSLQNAVNMATMRESQTAQTAQILAGQTAEVDALYNRLSNCPVPSTPVYGRTPIFTCGNGYNGCGCGAA